MSDSFAPPPPPPTSQPNEPRGWMIAASVITTVMLLLAAATLVYAFGQPTTTEIKITIEQPTDGGGIEQVDLDSFETRYHNCFAEATMNIGRDEADRPTDPSFLDNPTPGERGCWWGFQAGLNTESIRSGRLITDDTAFQEGVVAGSELGFEHGKTAAQREDPSRSVLPMVPIAGEEDDMFHVGFTFGYEAGWYLGFDTEIARQSSVLGPLIGGDSQEYWENFHKCEREARDDVLAVSFDFPEDPLSYGGLFSVAPDDVWGCWHGYWQGFTDILGPELIELYSDPLYTEDSGYEDEHWNEFDRCYDLGYSDAEIGVYDNPIGHMEASTDLDFACWDGYLSGQSDWEFFHGKDNNSYVAGFDDCYWLGRSDGDIGLLSPPADPSYMTNPTEYDWGCWDGYLIGHSETSLNGEQFPDTPPIFTPSNDELVEETFLCNGSGYDWPFWVPFNPSLIFADGVPSHLHVAFNEGDAQHIDYWVVSEPIFQVDLGVLSDQTYAVEIWSRSPNGDDDFDSDNFCWFDIGEF